jgi:tetratricopeptide (TPR) repeat protein
MAKSTYLCTGLSRDTGKRTFVAVEADNPEEAMRLADERGVIAENAEPLLPYVLREPVTCCVIAGILLVNVAAVIFWLVAASEISSVATAYCDNGWKFYERHDYDKALVAFNRALELDPKCSYAYCGRGCVWRAKKDYDRAMADFNRGIRLKPDDPSAYNNRGLVSYDKKDYDRAIADYDQAIRLAPNYAGAYSSLAWLRATCPDRRYRNGKAAYENANKAYRLAAAGGDKLVSAGTLAAACAESGDFEQARKWAQKAIETAPDEASKRILRSQLELYRQDKPYRE